MNKKNQMFLFFCIFFFGVYLYLGFNNFYGLGFCIITTIPLSYLIAENLKAMDKRKERIQRYGKYLRAAGLPEDIKDVLGQFVLFEMPMTEGGINLYEKTYKISRYSCMKNENLLTLHLSESDNAKLHIDLNDGVKEKIVFIFEYPEEERVINPIITMF